MPKLIISTLPILIGAALAASPDTHSGREVAETNTFVLIVGGILKDPAEQQTADRAAADLGRFFLETNALDHPRLRILTGPNSRIRPGPTISTSTAANLRQAIKTFGASARPQDRFVFYYVGQANIVGDHLRFNLPGPDVTHRQLAEWINTIPAGSKLIVLDCPGAGLAAGTMAARGRIIVCACTAEQPYATRFSEYFVPALLQTESDTDSDGRISLLEAFTRAAKQIDDWYRSHGLLKTETAVLEDNGDGTPSPQPWRYRQENADGLAASKFFLKPQSSKAPAS
ncbi:MAG: hypothetical protein JSU94_13285 [Phycisphaerales bacterium]|nr:MAG: hypothetical protein JSU94_13285 [Phycisphaerales bacterium]